MFLTWNGARKLSKSIFLYVTHFCRVHEENKVHYAAASGFDSIPTLELVNFFTDLKFQIDGFDELMGKH